MKILKWSSWQQLIFEIWMHTKDPSLNTLHQQLATYNTWHYRSKNPVRLPPEVYSISRSYQHQFLIQLRSISRNSNRFEVRTKKFFSLNNFPWFGRTESRNLLFEIAHCWLLKLPIETAYYSLRNCQCRWFFLLWKHVGSRQFADMKEMLEKFEQVLPIYIHCKTKKLKPATRAPMMNHPDATRQKKKWTMKTIVGWIYLHRNKLKPCTQEKN